MTPAMHNFLTKNTPAPEDYPIEEMKEELLKPAGESTILREIALKCKPTNEKSALTCSIALNEFAAYVLGGDRSDDAIRGILDSLKVIWSSIPR